MSNITVERVDARIKEIVDLVGKYNKAVSELNTEYQQLLGYKQALVDMKPEVTSEGVDEAQQLNENN